KILLDTVADNHGGSAAAARELRQRSSVAPFPRRSPPAGNCLAHLAGRGATTCPASASFRKSDARFSSCGAWHLSCSANPQSVSNAHSSNTALPVHTRLAHLRLSRWNHVGSFSFRGHCACSRMPEAGCVDFAQGTGTCSRRSTRALEAAGSAGNRASVLQ